MHEGTTAATISQSRRPCPLTAPSVDVADANRQEVPFSMHRSMAVDEHLPASGDPGAPLSAADDAFAKRGCCCFWIPFSPAAGPKSWERMPRVPVAATDPPTPLSRGWWASGGLKAAFAKVREWSERVARPKWKTFVRRFRRNRNAGGGSGSSRIRYGGKFGYDPLSYALNFDEGQDGDSDGDGARRAFSSRYVSPPVSTKSSMDLGGRDVPPLSHEGH